ncbi:uncharacterized protein E6C27_scaffold1023G00080 [Cucumis melo var. makuwa]|uniref:DUF7745 domain-containing protein n=1 Tax=Cucumis melo var. makuwa TaxID=1194695 RepID=A0A5A7VHI3_CUCMM|nr:uncharacterized protein E6C27_scaffold1023G00080 [Cucumis melo var. makuwa]
MVDTHASEVVAQLIPNEDSWKNVSQWSEHFQLESGLSWPKKLEVPLPKTCQLEFINNNLEELKSLWESLMPEQRAEFTKAYGSIGDLLYTTINTSTLQALSHFWDPVLKYFTFNTFDLTPTIEEYQALISLPVDRGNKLYIYDRKLTLQRSLSKFMGDIHASELKKHMKTKEGRNCIPINYLINLARGCLLGKKGLSLIALCIYGTVIFPRIKGYVEEEVVKIFVGIERGVNPVIPIMAETFRSLNHCQIQGKGKFFSCAPMLFIWISSHLRYPNNFGYPQIKFSSPWNKTRNTIREFNSAHWDPKDPEFGVWMQFFSHLTTIEAIWRAPWMPTSPLTYRCGKLAFISLLGLWGGHCLFSSFGITSIMVKTICASCMWVRRLGILI